MRIRHFITGFLSIFPFLLFFATSIREDAVLYAFSASLRQKLGISQPMLVETKKNCVAVIDAGLQPNHWYMRSGPVRSFVFGRTALKERIDYSNGHATAVVSMVRHVNPGAQVACYNTASFKEFTRVVDHLVKDPTVLVVNISKGYSRFDKCHPDLWRLAEAGKIVICSAGNEPDKKVDPRIVARLVTNHRAHGRILIVGAGYEKADKTYKLCDFSVRPNKSRAHYVVAPGEGLTAAVCNKQSSYESCTGSLSGTSFAAPIVAGLVHYYLLAHQMHPQGVVRLLKERQRLSGAVCVHNQTHYIKTARYQNNRGTCWPVIMEGKNKTNIA